MLVGVVFRLNASILFSLPCDHGRDFTIIIIIIAIMIIIMIIIIIIVIMMIIITAPGVPTGGRWRSASGLLLLLLRLRLALTDLGLLPRTRG